MFRKSEYPPNWTPEIRPRILARAGHCCEHCGVPEYAVGYRNKCGTLQQLGVGETFALGNKLRIELRDKYEQRIVVIRITIAHLDHDEWNHDVKDERLAALCERCHFHYDRDDNQKRKNYGRQYKRHQLSLTI